MALGHWAVEYLGEGNGQGGSGGGGSFVVHITGELGARSLDKTWQEIYDALAASRYVLALIQNEIGVVQSPITVAEIDGADYCVYVGNQTFKADSADGYPVDGTGSK